MPVPRAPDVFLRGDLGAPLRVEEPAFAAAEDRELLADPEEPADLREAVERLEPVADFALDEAPVDDALRVRDELLPEEVARPAVERVLVERFAVDPLPAEDLREVEEALDRRALVPVVDPDPDDEDSLGVHFPDITRCAASATASAMIDPSLVALETMLLAA